MLKGILETVRAKTPLIHCITNYVTVGDVANILLACGGSPIMADDAAEVEEITSICSGLVLNIGTLNSRTIDSMVKAGKRANELGHPVVLDPVGAGASGLRTETAFRLLGEVGFSVIRGNASEIKTLYGGSGFTKGVDADEADAVTEEGVSGLAEIAGKLSKRTGAVVAVTGAIDVVAQGDKAYLIRNGHPMMSRITGTGCMLSAVVAAYCAANRESLLDAAAAAVSAMGLCGELAYERVQRTGGGTGSFRTFLIDAMSNLSENTLMGGMKVESK